MKTVTAISFTFLFVITTFAQSQGEIIVPLTYLRKSPNPTAEKVETVQKGDKVTLEKQDKKNNWIYVSTLNGKAKGWISENTMRPLESETVITPPPTVSEKIEKPKEVVKPKETPKPRKEEPKVKEIPKPKEETKVKERPKVAVVEKPIEINRPRQVPPKGTPIIETKPTPIPTPLVENVTVAPTPIPTPAPIPTPDPNAPIEDNEVLKIETEEVSLNVRVTDNTNRAVNNLKEAQFQIYEDNVLQPITSFVTTEVPIVNALVIDNSRSLRSQLNKVIEAGKIIIGANQTKDVSTIFRFVSADKIEVVQEFTSNKNSLNNALDNLFVEGGQTAIIDAVYQAAQKVEKYQTSPKVEDIKVRAIILVSDGDDRSSSKTEQQLFQLLRASQVQIYAIGFINNLTNEPDANGISRQEKAKSLLTKLSSETGGKVYFPNSTDELSTIAAEISNDLRMQYVISYSPTNDNRDGSFRQIKVVVEDGATKEKRNAVTRTGRTSAPKSKP